MKDLEVRLEKFLTLALKSTPQPKLFDIYVSFLIFNTLNPKVVVTGFEKCLFYSLEVCELIINFDFII